MSPSIQTAKLLPVHSAIQQQPPMDSQTSKHSRIFTTEDFLDAVKLEKLSLIIFEGGVYDLTKFKKFHPGGSLVIDHVVGQDATEEIHAFHPKSVLTDRLPKYQIGTYLHTEDPNKDLSSLAPSVPSYSDSNPRKSTLHHDYLALGDKLRSLGFYEPVPSFYLRRIVWFALFLTFNISLVVYRPTEVPVLLLSAFLMGVFWQMLAFTSHDLGHHSVFGSTKVDTIVGIILADFFGGLSIGWWNHNHNTHHVVTNHPEHDPDIQHMPFLAVSEEFFKNLYSTFHKRVMKYDLASKIMISIQHYMFIFLLTFGRFNLYVQSIVHLFTVAKQGPAFNRYFEITGLTCFWIWYGYFFLYLTIPTWPLRLMYFYVSHVSTVMLHIQITLSHFAMSTDTPEDELFVEKGLRTTMDVDCPTWMDWLHGGLQFQVIHHLYPRLPRPHFRAVKPYIEEFCNKHGLKYHCYGFFHGNGLVLGVLKGVADQVQLFAYSSQPHVRYQKIDGESEKVVGLKSKDE